MCYSTGVMTLPVVILAAGRGTRMGELTTSRPKHLIEVASRPFLTYLLDNLVAAGCQDFWLVVGYQAAAAYEFAAREAKRYHLRLINQFERLGDEQYGTLMPLKAVAPELSGQPFLVVSGDNLYSPADLARLREVTGSAVAVRRHEHPERYGVVTQKPDGTVDRIIEKPSHPATHFINTGLYRMSSGIWPLLPKVERSSRGEYELTDAINLLAAREPVQVLELREYWYDFGKPEDIAKVAALVQGGLV